MGGWCHYVAQCGGVDGLVAKAKALGLNWLAVKAWDGDGCGDSQNPTVFKDQFAASVVPLKAAGFKVYAWGYCYGGPVRDWTSITPEREAAALMASVDGADGVILDAEYEYVNRKNEAMRFFNAVKVDIPLAFAPDFRILVGNAFASRWNAQGVDLQSEPWPWGVFNNYCQAILPQLYWTDFKVAPDVAFGLIDAWGELADVSGWTKKPVLPIMPFNASDSDLQAARACVNQRGLNGYSYWLLG